MMKSLVDGKFYCDICGKEAIDFSYILPSRCDSNGKMLEVYNNLCPECEGKLFNVIHSKFQSIHNEKQIHLSEERVLTKINEIQLNVETMKQSTKEKEKLKIVFGNTKNGYVHVKKDKNDLLFGEQESKISYTIGFDDADVKFYKKE